MLISDSEDRCPIHADLLQQEVVFVLYGLYRFTREFNDAHRYKFPFSRFFVLGGCMHADELFKIIKFCNRCRETHRTWCQNNASTEGLAPTDRDAELILQHYSGKLLLGVETPEEALELLKMGKEETAIKVLKSANKSIDISDLRTHLRSIRRHDELAQTILGFLSADMPIAPSAMHAIKKTIAGIGLIS